MRLRFLGRPLASQRKQEKGASEFADMVGTVVNATISQAPIKFVKLTEGENPMWFIAHVGTGKLPAPLPLVNDHYLFLYQLLGLRREEKYLATLEYRYVYQRTLDDDSWIFRYEYLREPPDDPYPYSLSHLHVNARPAAYAGDRPFPGLHLPTGRRITIEKLVRHLIAEHGIRPISRNWEEIVLEGEDHFRDVQKRRILTPRDRRE